MNIFKNWKTTSAGIIACAGAVILYLNDKTQIVAALTTLLSGIGLIFAGDASASE